MDSKEQVQNLVTHYVQKLAVDLNDSLNKALRKGGSKNPQEASLRFTPKIVWGSNEFNVQIIASGEYWYWIDKGRKPTKNSGEGSVRKGVGKKWQNLNDVDPAQIIYDLTVKYNEKKGLNRKVKKLGFAKASKSLSFLIARKIHKYGYKARPFRDKVVNDGRLQNFEKALVNLLGKQIIVNSR